MVVLVVTGVYWTRGVESALSEGGKAVQAYAERCTHDLMQVPIQKHLLLVSWLGIALAVRAVMITAR